MEPKLNSDQTVWDLTEKACRKAWGIDSRYEGHFCISLTISHCRHYLERFGRFPPVAILEDFAVKAVKVQKSNLSVCHVAELSYSPDPKGYKSEDSHRWAQRHKVSDFDN